jgi:hypothetical protein
MVVVWSTVSQCLIASEFQSSVMILTVKCYIYNCSQKVILGCPFLLFFDVAVLFSRLLNKIVENGGVCCVPSF